VLPTFPLSFSAAWSVLDALPHPPTSQISILLFKDTAPDPVISARFVFLFEFFQPRCPLPTPCLIRLLSQQDGPTFFPALSLLLALVILESPFSSSKTSSSSAVCPFIASLSFYISVDSPMPFMFTADRPYYCFLPGLPHV